MPHVIGERVILREFRQEDISGMRSWCNDPEVTRFLSGRYVSPIPWEQTEVLLSGFLHGDAGGTNVVVADKSTGRYLGQASLFMIDHQVRKAELAIVMAPDSQNKGLGSEALRLLLGFGFGELNLNRIHLTVYADNTRAIRVYEKAGFRREGILRQDGYRNGRYVDSWIMSVLREEYSDV